MEVSTKSQNQHGVYYFNPFMFSIIAVRIDTTQPLIGRVYDGSSPNMDVAFSNSITTFQANWNGFQDYESGIAQYNIEVRRQATRSPLQVTVHSESVSGTEREFSHNQFQFEDGDNVSVRVEAVNGAGATAMVVSNGVIIDRSPPQVSGIVDGNSLLDDLEFQSSNETLSATWNVTDTESGIHRILGSIFELREGRRTRIYPAASQEEGEAIPPNVTRWQVGDLDLESGARYFVALTFFNRAGLRIFHETNGVTVDLTPPIVTSVSVLSDSYLDTIDIDTVTMVADPNQTETRWIASDRESGISQYLVGVVDENATLVTPDYTSFEGSVTGGLIRNLNLTSRMTTYRVAVIALNNAGGRSEPTYSEPFRYVHV